jgi:integrase
VKLTDRAVHGFPLVSEGRKQYADDAVSGLSIRVGKTTKTFQLVIGTGASRKRFTLGTYPTLSLAQARQQARDILAQDRLEPEQPRTTFAEALELYYRVQLSTLRPTSIRAKQSSLERHFRPVFGTRALADIKRSDIAPILDRLTDTPAARHSAFKYLATFLNWCVTRGYLETAPTDRMEAPKGITPRDRVLSPAELVAIWHALPDDDYGRIVKLCLLTGQRRHQWAAARREYLIGDTITWPAELMKAGKAHTLPLTPRIAALLPLRIGYLFPNGSNIPYGNWTRPKWRLDAASKVSFRVHDLRRTWATVCAEELAIQPHIIEAVLAHASGTAVSRVYNRAVYLQPMRDALLAFDGWFAAQAGLTGLAA